MAALSGLGGNPSVTATVSFRRELLVLVPFTA